MKRRRCIHHWAIHPRTEVLCAKCYAELAARDLIRNLIRDLRKTKASS